MSGILDALGTPIVLGWRFDAPKTLCAGAYPLPTGSSVAQPIVIPDDQYIGIQAESEGLPDVWIINQAMDGLEPKSAFPWHLSIIVAFEDVSVMGLPSKTEDGVLAKVGDIFDLNLMAGGNAVVLARITWNQTRQYIYRVRDPEVANDYLTGVIDSKSELRPFEFQMEEDPEWEFAEDYLRHARGQLPDA
jgi:hypothetical protein